MAISASVFTPAVLRAQQQPIRIGTVTPLTGAQGIFGPVMADCARALAKRANDAGGLLGRQIQVISEDSQSNPEVAVRATRKLIDLDKVSAIIGGFTSADAAVMLPLCWESKTVLFSCAGADSLANLPHQGYFFRNQLTGTQQGEKFGQFCVDLHAKRVMFMAAQTPFTQDQYGAIKAAVEKAGGATDLLIYDIKKSTLRTEVDLAMKFKPDAIIMGGIVQDSMILLRDLYRANYSGITAGFSVAINDKLISALPPEVTEGVYAGGPAPSEQSEAYRTAGELMNVSKPDPYLSIAYDQMNLILLAIENAKDASGEAIKANIRKVSQGAGKKTGDLIAGLNSLRAGQEINYEGASGGCTYAENGNIADGPFRYDQVRKGKLEFVKVS
jgi:branched-chain amino acid transport system substrate-binding protein